MQPCHIAEGRKVATQLGTDVLVFEYRQRTRMNVNGQSRRVSYDSWGIATPEDFEWWATNFEILASCLVSPQEV